MADSSFWMFRRELARTPLLWATPVVLFLGGWMVFAADYQQIHVTDRATVALMASVQTMGPVCAGLGAWAAMRGRRGGVTHLLTLSPRSRLGALGPYLMAVTAVLCLPYIILVGVQLVRAVFRQGEGSLDGLGILVGLAGIVVHVLLGFLLGTFIPRRVTIVALPIVLYIAEVGTQDLSIKLFSPTQVHTLGAFWTWQTGLLATQLVWLLSGTVLMIGLLVAATDRRIATAAVVVVALAGLAVSGSHLASFDGRVLLPGNAPFQYVCRDHVCVHPGYEKLVPEIASAFAPVTSRLKGTPAAISTLEQRPRGVGGYPSPGRTAFHLDDPKANWQTKAVDDLIDGLVRWEACDPATDGALLSSVVSSWLASPAGARMRPPADEPAAASGALAKFVAASESKRRTWLQRNYDAFAGCTLTVSQVGTVGVL